MTSSDSRAGGFTRLSAQLMARLLPFADAAGGKLTLLRLLRLSLFQVSVGMAIVLLNGTLNRVMVIELQQAAWLVSLMVSLPLLFAPLRALIGFRSDHHRSLLGWRRVPYIWAGSMMQFGGLAIMPFALLVLSGGSAVDAPAWVGPASAALAFLLVGAGLHTTQTAGLALATDLASDVARPRIVALLYTMLLLGMIGSSLVFAYLLSEFSPQGLVQVIQGAAVVTIVLNLTALWKQEARDQAATAPSRPRPAFRDAWQSYRKEQGSFRLLVAVGLGTAGFSMQDILLEPYGGEILGMSVGQTTGLTALLAGGMLVAFLLASRRLSEGADPVRLAAYGALAGVFAFATVVLASPLNSTFLFKGGTALIGFGGGLFAIGTLTAAMVTAKTGQSGLALGAWGAVQATAAGLAIAAGGAMRDLISAPALAGSLGEALASPVTGYAAVYHLEIVLLFAALVAIGPLVRQPTESSEPQPAFALAAFPE